MLKDLSESVRLFIIRNSEEKYYVLLCVLFCELNYRLFDVRERHRLCFFLRKRNSALSNADQLHEHFAFRLSARIAEFAPELGFYTTKTSPT